MVNCGNKKKWLLNNYGSVLLGIVISITSVLALITFSGYSIIEKNPVLIVSIFLFITLIVFSIMFMAKRKAWKIEKLFLISGLLLGAFYSVFLPIGGAPDEPAHFWRAYELSEGQLFANNEGNMLVPDNLLEATGNSYSVEENGYKKELENFSTVANTNHSPINGPADRYSFFNYIPQTFGVIIGKILNIPIIPTMIISRIFNMASCIVALYFCIKYIPVMKKLIFLIAMFPMTMQLLSSVSADGSIICAGIALISFVFYFREEKEKSIGWKESLLLLLICIVLTVSKPVYAFLCPIVFWIPKERFLSHKRKNIAIFSIGAITILFVLFRMATSPLGSGRFGTGQDQTSFIMSNPMSFLAIIFKNIFIRPDEFINGVIGKDLEWFSVSMFYPYIITLFIFFLFLCAEKETKIPFSLKIFTLCSFSAIVVFTFTTMFITWSVPGSSIIDGVQGRYFLPVLLLIPIFCLPTSRTSQKRILVKPNYLYITAILTNVYAIAAILCAHI